MTILSLVQAACDRLGIARPSAVMSSGDSNIVIMRALATQEGRELARRANWQRLVKERQISTLAQEVQTGAIPTDFDRAINDTFFNYTQDEELFGPRTPREWQVLKSSGVGPPDLHFRIRGGDLLIYPDPPAGEDVRFEYVSKWWVDTDGDGAGDADAWAADTDAAVLDEELITMGVVWRFLKRNSLSFDAEYAEYLANVTQAITRDGARTTRNMAGSVGLAGDPSYRVPDGSWNLP